MKSYETMLDALNDLQKKGFTYDFNLRQDCIYCSSEQQSFQPHEFEIREVHRFEEMSDPSENAVVYAIESPGHGIKGTLVNAYGIYSDSFSGELIEKMNQLDV